MCLQKSTSFYKQHLLLPNMKIFSYNVNGIRSAINKGFTKWLESENPDIVCIQEIKANVEQIDPSIFEHLGYHHYWHSAEKKGYSGVAVLTKIKPNVVQYGCQMPQYDCEGRVLLLQFSEFTLINTYFPSGSAGDVRQNFKMQFLYDYEQLVVQWKSKYQRLLICGDFNICHQPIDIHDPISNKNSSGFLPEERAWLSKFLNENMIDTFRYFNTMPHQYSWWSYRAGARKRNKGWRIDYITISRTLQQQLLSAHIHQEIIHSDHCPVSVEINI